MADPQKIPKWLKSLPSAPEYRPTETEFADPIAFISRIEQEAAAFGICKVIPPLPKPSKKFVLSNLTRSLSSSPSSSSSTPTTRFTTRHQELGTRKGHLRKQQVWQSGEFYTLEQFESKSKTFHRSFLSSFKEVTPLLIESLFWQAAAEKPIYIEYANDVPGSGFAAPEEPFLYRKKRRKFTGEVRNSVEEGTAGCKLSNSPWNLQVIARAPGSLTRFMPDEVPGVTSPMVYIGMLFSWFAWHVEDHELHSLNFLHMGAPKTWYAVPGEYASTLEELVRMKGYGGDMDRLEAFTMLGEKTTLLSPEVIVDSGIPCCRLVQNPGEFVVTFPRAYHVGFSHGFNCGEAANFATPRWLKVAKEAALRRAAMDYLPMLSHQQLLYMLTVSFISRIPRTLLSGVRSSRSKDRKKVDREILVKKAFLNDMMNENNLLCTLLSKDSTSYAVLWEPDLLPNAQSFLPLLSLEAPVSAVSNDDGKDGNMHKHEKRCSFSEKANNSFVENSSHEITSDLSSLSCHTLPSAETCKKNCQDASISDVELLEILDTDEDDLPLGLHIDSGTLACVSCGILGYPLMAIVQPSETALKEFYSKSSQNMEKSGVSCRPLCQPDTSPKSQLEETDKSVKKPDNPHLIHKLSPQRVSLPKGACLRDDIKLLDDVVRVSSNLLGEFNPENLTSNSCSRDDLKANNSNHLLLCAGLEELGGNTTVKSSPAAEVELVNARVPDISSPVKERSKQHLSWVPYNEFSRPQIFCLQHALEIEELLLGKGGAKVLVICHSDYLKIKAYAPSIAEDVGMQFCIKDVPLENASSADLNLINISIDDGEHEGHTENWTSKLGVNLRHCVKLRKQSTSEQERLSVALARLFSDPFSLSDASTLKWQLKRSRTPYKVVGLTVAKPRVNTNSEKGNVADRNLDADLATYVKGYCSWKREPNDMGSKHYHSSIRKGIRTESFSTGGSLIANGKNGSTSDKHGHNEKNRDDNGLFSVPISATEDIQTSQCSWLPLKVSTAYEVSDPDRHGSSYKCGSDTSKEFLINAVYSDSVSSKAEQEIEALDEINNLEHDVYDTVESGAEPTSNGTVGYCRDSRDLEVARDHNQERQEGNFLLPVDLDRVTVLSFYNDEKRQEISVLNEPKNFRVTSNADEYKMGGLRPCSRSEGQEDNLQLEMTTSVESNRNNESSLHSSTAETLFINNLSAVDDRGMQPVEISVTENNLQNGADSEHSTVSSEVQRKSYCINGEDRDNEVSHPKLLFDLVETCKRNRDTACAIQYVRRTKRKREKETEIGQHMQSDGFTRTRREDDIISEEHLSFDVGFIRSPCEGLRPRARSAAEKAEAETVVRNRAEKKAGSVSKDGEQKEFYKCKIEGCRMIFRTSRELLVHKQNRCTYKGCRKSFKSHGHLKRHCQVHDDERPLKCPWKGCGMSFKWGWARTEHLRIHTGERPYKCAVAECQLTFRYISDFSRHRRKTGHYVNSTVH